MTAHSQTSQQVLQVLPGRRAEAKRLLRKQKRLFLLALAGQRRAVGNSHMTGRAANAGGSDKNKTGAEMEDSITRKLDKFEREEAFMVDNAADFGAGTPGATTAAALSAMIAEIRNLAAEQASGASTAAQAFGNQDDALDDLITLIKKMNLAARGFDDEIPGSRDQFRMPRNRSLQNILATARAFHADSQAIEAKFVEYGLRSTFRAELQDAINAVETAAQSADSNVEQRAAATGGLFDAARRGTSLSRRLNSIVRIKYADNPAKLAAWTVASHLERVPKRAPASASPTP